MYYTKANQIRISIDEREDKNNIRYLGDYSFRYKNEVIIRLINKMIREIDIVYEEIRYVKEKFRCKADVVDKLVRENIKALVKMAVVCKCYCRLNHYNKRDKAIN